MITATDGTACRHKGKDRNGWRPHPGRLIYGENGLQC